MCVERLRSLNQFKISKKLNTGKTINQNAKQLIIVTKVYKNKNTILGFSLTFTENFSYSVSSHLSFIVSLPIDYFAINRDRMKE